mmetsp:Transcript_31644/g.37235  ORF Transcript_31644/g.37235 Transcript_31644/m.37235 type:complete len:242 (+) Transcript_31644:1-726(+)
MTSKKMGMGIPTLLGLSNLLASFHVQTLVPFILQSQIKIVYGWSLTPHPDDPKLDLNMMEIDKDESAWELWAKDLVNSQADPSKTLHWVTKGAAGGDVDAQYMLGIAYRDGYRTAQNIPRAIGFLGKAAQRRHTKASFLFGIACWEGIGRVKDEKLALHWWAKSGNDGHMKAAHNAIAGWNIHAKEHHDKDAQYHLGHVHENGHLGATKDLQHAIDWYTLAAEQNHQKAKERLIALQAQEL